MIDARFEREAMLIGEESLENLKGARVCLFGVGGVGSYAAETIARCGVGALDIVDNDKVSISNINRQLCALESTVGMYKVDVIESRVKDVNPDIKVTKYRQFVLPENIDSFDFSNYDYIIDAIDTVSAKIAIVEKATRENIPVLSCMGTGNKLDPTALCVTDIRKTNTCPLARVMRRELKARGIAHLKVVYSTEPPAKVSVSDLHGRHAPASIAFVPSVAGIIAASEAVKYIISKEEDK